MAKAKFPEDIETLAEAREWIKEQIQNKGAMCPCCKQFAKVHARKMTASMGQGLVTMYRAGEFDYHHIPSLFTRARVAASNDGALTRHWGFIEPMPEAPARGDGNPRKGWWRLTDSGRAFIEGRITSQKKCMIYSQRFLGLTGERVSISDVLGEPFDYRELMDWVVSDA